MTNILYNFYFRSKNRKVFSKHDFLGRFWTYLLRKLTPLVYTLTIPFQKKGVKKQTAETEIIVSLTSFPGRINVVWQAIESILRQSQKPDKIILWLGKENFSGLDELPSVLKSQMKRGLNIELRDDIKPHTKYYYAIKENPDSVVITIDDDIVYPSCMISELLKYHHQSPNSIICHGARKIKLFNDFFAPYSEWNNWHEELIESFERFDILPLGVMGVLYPSKSLHRDVFNVEKIKETCLNADDLWLKTMSLKQGTKVIITNSYQKPFVGIPDSQTVSLMSTNVGSNQNDVQLEALNNEYGIFNLYQTLNRMPSPLSPTRAPIL